MRVVLVLDKGALLDGELVVELTAFRAGAERDPAALGDLGRERLQCGLEVVIGEASLRQSVGNVCLLVIGVGGWCWLRGGGGRRDGRCGAMPKGLSRARSRHCPCG